MGKKTKYVKNRLMVGDPLPFVGRRKPDNYGPGHHQTITSTRQADSLTKRLNNYGYGMNKKPDSDGNQPGFNNPSRNQYKTYIDAEGPRAAKAYGSTKHALKARAKQRRRSGR